MTWLNLLSPAFEKFSWAQAAGSVSTEISSSSPDEIKLREKKEKNRERIRKFQEAREQKRREAEEEAKRQEAVACQKPVITLYSPDPAHPFNKIYDLLYVRKRWDDCYFGKDAVDPILFSDSTYLFEEPRYSDLIAELTRLQRMKRDFLEQDNLHFALFQRDLLLVFHQLMGRTTSEAATLRVALRQVIQSVALSKSEIQSLPANIHSALKSHSSSIPEAVLNGVLVSAEDGPVAPVHFKEFDHASAFYVYFLLPGGFHPTNQYIKALREQKQAMLKDSKTKDYYYRNPSTPQFPGGTSVALLRNAILLSDQGEPVVSPLSESMQFRKYTRVGETIYPGTDQEVAMLELSRAVLLSGKMGGMVSVSFKDLRYEKFLGLKHDPLSAKGATAEAPLTKCVRCHGQYPAADKQLNTGIHSVHSYTRDVGGGHIVARFYGSNQQGENNAVVRECQKSASWKFLSKTDLTKE